MMLVYMTAPAAALIGAGLGETLPAVLGAGVWLLMSAAYAPTVRLYGLSPVWAITLPASALLYTMMTIDSARRYWSGRAAEWKNRLNGGLTTGIGFDERSSARHLVPGQGRWSSATRAQNL